MSSRDGVRCVNSWEFQSRTSHFQDCKFSISLSRWFSADMKYRNDTQSMRRYNVKRVLGGASLWAGYLGLGAGFLYLLFNPRAATCLFSAKTIGRWFTGLPGWSSWGGLNVYFIICIIEVFYKVPKYTSGEYRPQCTTVTCCSPPPDVRRLRAWRSFIIVAPPCNTTTRSMYQRKLVGPHSLMAMSKECCIIIINRIWPHISPPHHLPTFLISLSNCPIASVYSPPWRWVSVVSCHRNSVGACEGSQHVPWCCASGKQVRNNKAL